MYYEDVFRKLNEKKVRYLVVGGVALVLHGIVRLTVDVDFMVDLNKQNLVKFVSALKELGYKPKLPVKAMDFVDVEKRRGWMKEKNMKVFSFHNPEKPFEIVDVFVENPLDFNESYRERKLVKIDDLGIPIISLKNLIKLKKISGRAHDIADVKSLEELINFKNEGKRRG